MTQPIPVHCPTCNASKTVTTYSREWPWCCGAEMVRMEQGTDTVVLHARALPFLLPVPPCLVNSAPAQVNFASTLHKLATVLDAGWPQEIPGGPCPAIDAYGPSPMREAYQAFRLMECLQEATGKLREWAAAQDAVIPPNRVMVGRVSTPPENAPSVRIEAKSPHPDVVLGPLDVSTFEFTWLDKESMDKALLDSLYGGYDL